jgi:hypothetical protein
MATYTLNDPTKTWTVTANNINSPQDTNIILSAPGVGYVSFPDAYIVINTKRIFIQSADPAISSTVSPGDIWFDLL